LHAPDSTLVDLISRSWRARRIGFGVLLIGISLPVVTLAVRVLEAGGWTKGKLAILACLLGNIPWLALSTGNAVTGFIVRQFTKDPLRVVLPSFRQAPPRPRALTVVAFCIRNEDMNALLPSVTRLLDSLALSGVREYFSLWFLSDTQDSVLSEQERSTIESFRAARADAQSIYYRRRTSNTGFKAGNIMDFLEAHSGPEELMLCLDADSEMTAAAIVRLVGCMEMDPKLALVQQLTVGRPAGSAFARLAQFGMRAGMRTWAMGQAWWQGPDGPYWGHNAVVRIAPFRTHCRLAPLPNGDVILSHDQVEAVRLRAAGWKVMCLPDEEGSFEGHPPALPEYMARDGRWASGNLQYVRLLLLTGITWLGRWQLVQAILLFLGSPLWVATLILSTRHALTTRSAGADQGLLLALALALVLTLSAPKLMGYLEVLCDSQLAARYGGRLRFSLGMIAELLFAAVLAPIMMVHRTLELLRLALRGNQGWAPQRRNLGRHSWQAALHLLWPHTLLGILILVVFIVGRASALPWILPFIAGLLLAIPFCVATSSKQLSDFLQRAQIAATPEELHCEQIDFK
jgi:membrane glycosyltransferase